MMKEENKSRADEIAQNWHILYIQNRRCVACSDGGIDCDDDFERRIPILPDMVVFEGEEPVGISYSGHLFLLADPSTHKLTIEDPEKFVGGWGDVTETHYYTLTPGPAVSKI